MTDKTKLKKKQVARNDDKCDESKHGKANLPRECLTKSGTGASAANSTQGQSGGNSGTSGSDASSSGAAGSSSSGASSK
jgi:hypothetical protein